MSRPTVKLERLFIITLLLVSGFLRLYRFSDFMEFLGDQGRDALVAKHILIDHHPTLLGPTTSVGNMYLGPLYYYFMVPFLAITYPSPIGPAYAIAFLSVLTTLLIYYLGKEMIGKEAAGIAAVLYAVTPNIIFLSRFSWQPNPAPFFGLVMLWLTYKAIKGKTWYWLGVWICFTVLSQLHYVALLSAVPSFLFFVCDIWKQRKNRKKIISFIKIIGVSAVIFLLSVLPLAIFDFRHSHLVLKGFQTFLASSQQHSLPLGRKIVQVFADLHGIGMKIMVELLGFSKEHRMLNTYILIGIILSAVFMVRRDLKRKKDGTGLTLLVSWLVILILGLSIYRNNIYVHYYAFAFPAIFLFFGKMLGDIFKLHVVAAGVVSIGVLYFCFSSIRSLPYWVPAAFGVSDVQHIVDKTLPYIYAGEKYNIALLNDNREYMGMKYRYFFEAKGKPAQSEYNYTGLDKLVVIVENGERPLDAPIYEVEEFKREVASPVLEKQLSYKDAVNIYVYTRKKQ